MSFYKFVNFHIAAYANICYLYKYGIASTIFHAFFISLGWLLKCCILLLIFGIILNNIIPLATTKALSRLPHLSLFNPLYAL